MEYCCPSAAFPAFKQLRADSGDARRSLNRSQELPTMIFMDNGPRIEYFARPWGLVLPALAGLGEPA